jgi:hypothetical protein
LRIEMADPQEFPSVGVGFSHIARRKRLLHPFNRPGKDPGMPPQKGFFPTLL